ncbi:N-methyl-L-tryptophan oxidase [Lysinibacillus sp. KU-BSD001]|uniref:N-methyl-L-tryptophan oxidase n=1 Tax=Lysinibacillus sp. KU-BSD001 TaxID=3141328 RepID=UPI0036ED8201
MKFDSIIIGAGSMGMAAAYFLAKAGKKVCMIDAFDPPHTNGSHHGETRIIRYAYGEGIEYVPLALRAAELWEELEHEVEKPLLLKTGVINIGNKDNAFVQTVIESARAFDLPLEVLNAEEITKRWPGIKVDDHMIAAFEPTSGVLRVEDCVAAYKALAIEAGATLHVNEPVQNIRCGDVVVVKTAVATYEADTCIVCAGAWTSELLKPFRLSLNPIRKTFAWFEAEEGLYGQENFPAFAVELKDACYYGFPSIDRAGYKIGRHDGGETIHPNDELRPFDEGDALDLQQFIQSYMPQVGALKEGKVCKYTMTPDEHFIIDYLPEHKNIIVASGFSGHGFKFSSAIGEMLAQMVIDGKSKLSNELFKLSRF